MCRLSYRIASNRIFNVSLFAHWAINDATHITWILLFHSLGLSWNVQLKVNDLIAFCFVANLFLPISIYVSQSPSFSIWTDIFNWISRLAHHFLLWQEFNLSNFFFIISYSAHLRSCPLPQTHTHTHHSFCAQKVHIPMGENESIKRRNLSEIFAFNHDSVKNSDTKKRCRYPIFTT